MPFVLYHSTLLRDIEYNCEVSNACAPATLLLPKFTVITPSSNGAVEQFIQTFKKAVKLGEHQRQPFDQYLSMFLLTYRSTAHSKTNMSPCTYVIP